MQEQGPCIFGVIGKTDCGGMVSGDNSEALSCRNSCQGEKAVAETFNKVYISQSKDRSLSFISGEVKSVVPLKVEIYVWFHLQVKRVCGRF
jgi:hypothetical protein